MVDFKKIKVNNTDSLNKKSTHVDKPTTPSEEKNETANPVVDDEKEITLDEKPLKKKSTHVDKPLEEDTFPDDETQGFTPANPFIDDDEEAITESTDVDNDTFDDNNTITNPLLEDDDETTKTQKLKNKVIKNTEKKRFFPEGLDKDFDKKIAEAASTKIVSAAKREEKIRKQEAEKQKKKQFKSDYHRKPSETVTVNEKGETLQEAKQKRTRLKKPEPKGKLSEKELDFYSTMGKRKYRYTEGVSTIDLLSGPMNEHLTTQQRKQRTEKLARVFDTDDVYRKGGGFKLNQKIMDMLTFLALFRYATHSHMSRMFGESQRTTLDRLYKMRNHGLVESRKIYAQHAIWFLTDIGITVSGFSVKKVTDSRITYSMLPHQFTVNHVAANLWGGKLDVLKLGDIPQKNRTNIRGQKVFGEQLTSELEIMSSFSKMKLFEDSSTFRPKLMQMMSDDFQKWADGDRTKPSPEMITGNEWMYALFPSLSIGVAYHVPDLVVKRPRAKDGSPQSVAVEIEISNKPIGSYKKTLQAYAEDKRVFSKVVWVCKTIGPARKLEKIGKELGTYQSGKLKIVPILTNDGVFKGRDLWTI